MNGNRLNGTKSGRKNGKLKVRHIIGVLLMIYIIYVIVCQQVAINEARAKEEEIKKQIEALKEENQRIKAELERMQDEKYIERIARERLGLIKPGEIMFIDVNYKDHNKGN